MNVIRSLRRPLALVLAVLVTGCYTYVPMEQGSPQAGDRVAVELTGRGVQEFGDQTGSARNEVRGTVVRAGADSLRLRTYLIRDPAVAGPSGLTYDTVSVSYAGIRRVTRQELDTAKTLALTALGLGAAVALVAGAVGGQSGSDPPGNGGRPPRAVIPVPDGGH